jgi:hypothetical protein
VEVQARPDAMDLRILQLIRDDTSSTTRIFAQLEKEYSWLHRSTVDYKLLRLERYDYIMRLNEDWSLTDKGRELVSSGAQILVTTSFAKLPTVPFDLIATVPVDIEVRDIEGNRVDSYKLGFASQTFLALAAGFERYINTFGAPVWIKPRKQGLSPRADERSNA